MNEQSLDVADVITKKYRFTVITIKQRDGHELKTKEFEFSQSIDVVDLRTEIKPFLTSYRFLNEWT